MSVIQKYTLELNEFTYKVCLTAIQRIPFQKMNEIEEAIMITVIKKDSKDYNFQIWRIDDEDCMYELNIGGRNSDPFKLCNMNILKWRYFARDYYIELSNRCDLVNPYDYLDSDEIRILKEECGLEKTTESSSTGGALIDEKPLNDKKEIKTELEKFFDEKVKAFNPNTDDILNNDDKIDLTYLNLPSLTGCSYTCIFKKEVYLFTFKEELNILNATIIDSSFRHLIIKTEHGIYCGQSIGCSDQKDTNIESLYTIDKKVNDMTNEEFIVFSSDPESYTNVAKVGGYSLLKKMYNCMINDGNMSYLPGNSFIHKYGVLFFKVLLQNYINGIHTSMLLDYMNRWYIKNMTSEQQEESKTLIKESIRLVLQTENYDINRVIELLTQFKF